jgi:hypothetical protein
VVSELATKHLGKHLERITQSGVGDHEERLDEVVRIVVELRRRSPGLTVRR